VSLIGERKPDATTEERDEIQMMRPDGPTSYWRADEAER